MHDAKLLQAPTIDTDVGAREALMSVAEPATTESADALLSGSCVVNFCATWAEPCAHCNTVFAELSREHPHLSFVQARAAPRSCAPSCARAPASS